jgi:hypothetical protein
MAEHPTWGFTAWQSLLITNGFWILEGVFILKFLTDTKWWKAVSAVFILALIGYFFIPLHGELRVIFDLFFYLALPLFFIKNDYLFCIILSVLLMTVLYRYQETVLFYARNYAEWARTCPAWGALSSIDYFVFVWLICFNRDRVKILIKGVITCVKKSLC